MPTPKAVVFDLGKVLLDFDYHIAISKLVPYCSATSEDLHTLINQSPLLYRYETGLISSAEFFDEIKSSAKFRDSFEIFEPIFGAIFSPILPMIDLHRSLRSRGITTAIFSNTNELAIRHIRHTYPFFSEFDQYILSFEHRSMKPSPEIYTVVEKAVAATGPEILYIDDRLENIETGALKNWQTVHHRDPSETIAKVQNILP